MSPIWGSFFIVNFSYLKFFFFVYYIDDRNK
nr:MAG TPA: hypothetical protein [Caudoviricetes sp.]